NPTDESSLTYNQLFELILQKLNDIFANKRTIIILCPSLSDVTHYYPLPQPAYNLNNIKSLNSLEIVKKRRLKLIGNPQIFQLNETILGVANFDVVKDISSNSIFNDKKPTDSALEMILSQRSFYPVLTNSITEDSEKIEKT